MLVIQNDEAGIGANFASAFVTGSQDLIATSPFHRVIAPDGWMLIPIRDTRLLCAHSSEGKWSFHGLWVPDHVITARCQPTSQHEVMRRAI